MLNKIKFEASAATSSINNNLKFNSMTAPQPSSTELSVTKDSHSKFVINKVDGSSESSFKNKQTTPIENHEPECNEAVATGTVLVGEEKTSSHDDSNFPVYCDICLKSFKTSFHLKKHKTRIHREKTFQCNICDKSYTMKCLLKAHIDAVHQKKFTCTCCEKDWGDKAQLNRHLKSKGKNQSVKEKPFPCNYCDKTFASIASANQHVLYSHTNVGEFLCDICNKTFGEKYNMLTHRKRHNDATSSPGNCDPVKIKFNKQSVHTAVNILDDIIDKICNKNMATVANLPSVHTCHQCNRSFETLYQLKRHTKMHMVDSNNIQCEKCSQIFFTKALYYEHRPCKIKCPICDYETLKNCNLMRHIKRYHT